MALFPHLGVTPGKSARLDEIIIAPSGEAFNASDAISFGYRELGSMSFKSKFVTDFAQQQKQYAWTVNIQHTSFQPTFPLIRDAYLMTKRFVIARVREAVTQDKYYFIDDPTPASPTGTTNLGIKFTYKHTVDKATLDIQCQGQMSQLQYDYMISQVGNTIAGETGGATLGLTGGGYAENKFIPGNNRTIQITNPVDGSGFIGSILDFDFELASMAEDDVDSRERFIHNKFKYTLKGRCKNVEALEQGAYNQDTKGVVVVNCTDAIGRVIQINQARETATITLADNKRDCEFMFTGEVNQNPNEATPQSIDIGVTNANILVLSTMGLN